MGQKEQSTHQNIIEAVKVSFQTEGYKPTSIRTVAEKAGITQSVLSNHFDSKEELFIAASVSAAEEVKESLLEISTGEELCLKDKLTEMTEYLMKKAPLDFYLMTAGAQGELSEESYSYLYKVWQKSYQQPIIDLFESQEELFKKSLSPKVAASHYFLMLSPYLNNPKNENEPLPVDKVIEIFLKETVK